MASLPWAPAVQSHKIHVPERDSTIAATRMHQAILRCLPVRQAHEEALAIKRGANEFHSESNFIRPDRFR